MPKGTVIFQKDRAIFTAYLAGTFLFIDEHPELDWAHEALLAFIPDSQTNTLTIVDSGSMLPGHQLIAPDGTLIDSLWRRFK